MTASSGLIWEWVRQENSCLLHIQGSTSHLRLEHMVQFPKSVKEITKKAKKEDKSSEALIYHMQLRPRKLFQKY